MLKDILIVITGGKSGLGQTIAKKLHENLATVITTSREIPFNHNKIRLNAINHQYLDVTNADSVNKFFLWLSHQSLKPSVLINNAGIGIFKPIIEISLEEWNSIINTNLTGAFLCSKHAYKSMSKSGGGRIINIGSVVELAGIEDNAAYAASKSGLRAMSFVISQEGRTANVTSTHITLGAVYSDIWKNRAGFNKEDMLDIEHVSEIIRYIASLPFNIRIDNLEITPSTKIL
jgi:NAD(P)-dependent dehydrogenase (short-subunit alcohol dehydrogenase family)